MSPVTLSEASVTVANLPPSYTLFCPVAVTVKARAVMSALVEATVLKR